MPARNLVVHPAQERIAEEFWRHNDAHSLTVTEFARRLEKRGLSKERSALSRILRCQTAAVPHELQIMAVELGLLLTWSVKRNRHRAA